MSSTRFNRVLLASAVFSAFYLYLPEVVQGQAISGDLVGTVTDSSRAVVANATVVAVQTATNATATVKANQSGEFRFVNLPIGAYNVTASAPGLNNKEVRGVQIQLNQATSLPIQLNPATVTTTVEVTDAAVAIDATSAQLQTSYTRQQILDLPTTSTGSGVLSLSLLQPGVTLSGGMGAGVGPSVGGQRPKSNDFTIEGVDNNNKQLTGPLISVPNDAVASFTLLENQFSPEFGHSSGGQFNQVILSGTNAFHGVLYEYFQNRDLNAMDVAYKNQGLRSNPRYDNNRFGGTIGGPILKNKLFFFQDLEYNPIGRTASAPSPVLSFTQAGYNELNNLAGLSQTNLSVLQKYVAPAPTACPPSSSGTVCPSGGTVNVLGTAIPVGILPVAAASYTNNFWSVTSVDYNVSDANSIRFRYLYGRQDLIDTTAQLPAFYTNRPTRSDLVSLSEYHGFTPHLNNEFRLSFNRTYNVISAGNFSFPGLDSFPNVTFADLSIQVGPNPNSPQELIINTYQMIDSFSWQKGHHDLRFGAEARKYISPQSFVGRVRGDYEYTTVSMYLQDVSPNQLGQRGVGVPVYYGDQVALYGYATDNWRITPKLTVNLGLRYEYTTVPYSQRSQTLNQLADDPRLITFDAPKAPAKNFAPRVGFAWSPDGEKTVVRGGFGTAYDVIYDGIGVNQLPPELSVTENVNLTSQSPGFLAHGGLPGGSGAERTFASVAAARAATSDVCPVNLKDPYAVNWNLGVQRSFAGDYVLDVRYVGTRGVHLDVQDYLDLQAVVTPQRYLPTYLTAPSQASVNGLSLTLANLEAQSHIVPAYANAGFTNPILSFIPTGTSNYNGLQAQLTKRFSHGLQLQTAYTWSHAIDVATADFFTTYLTPRRPQDFQNINGDRASSALDRRQRLTIALMYQTPWFQHSSNWLLRNVVGNFTIAPIYTFQSPEYATVQDATDSNLNGDSAGDRAIVNSSGVPGTGSAVTALANSTIACPATNGVVPAVCVQNTVAYVANNPNAQYIRAGLGALSNEGRNTLPLPRISTWDVSVTKRLNFGERLKFQFAAQAYNVFNHPQFVPGSLDDIASIQAATTSVWNFLTPGSSNFHNPSQTFSSQPRTLQLAAKLIF